MADFALRCDRIVTAENHVVRGGLASLVVEALHERGILVVPDVLANAGARPWDRDDIDRRILENAIEGRGKHIDSETEVGGYPKHAETRQVFVPADWDLDTMEPLKPLPRRAPLR